MKAECIAAVRNAALELGKTLGKNEIQGIETKVIQAQKQLAKQDIAAWRGMSREQQLKKAGEMVVNDAIHVAIKKRQRAELTIMKRHEREAVFGKMMAKGLTRMEALMYYTFFKADGRGGIISMASLAKGYESIALGRIQALNDLEHSSFLGSLVTNEKVMMDYLNESYGIDSGNALAKKAFKEVDAARKAMIDEFNRKGGDIRLLETYRNPQHLDPFHTLKNGGKNGKDFIEDHMNLVDREEYVNPDGTLMDDDQLRKFLKEAYITISTDGKSKPPGEGGSGSVANRMRSHREIHYKSPEAYLFAMKKYGSGNVFDQIRSSFSQLAKDIALVERFGPNAIHEFDTEYAKAIREGGKEKFWNGHIGKTFARFSGQQSMDNVVVAHTFQQIRNAMAANRLGQMLLSQMADTGTMDATARAMNIPLSELAAWMARIPTDKELRKALRYQGIGVDVAINSIARFADDTSKAGFFGKAATAVPIVQGAHVWTRFNRQSFAASMEAKLGDIVSEYKSMADLPEIDRRIMESKGITESDFALWKMAKPLEYKGSKLLGADAIYEIPLQDVLKVYPEKAQKVYDQFNDIVSRMAKKNKKEQEWIKGREEKLFLYKEKIASILDSYKKTREDRKQEISERYLHRSGELLMRLDDAEIDTQIASESIKAMNEKRADKFMQEIKRGMEWYGRRRSEIGERLGAQRHSAKLASYANEAAIERIGKDIAEKFNKLFGPERTEDGLKVVGDVVKAAKEFEAYAKKMEDRIERATKRDGTPKAGKEGTINRAELLAEQSRIEFEAIRQRAETAIGELRSKSEGKIMEIEALQKAIDKKRIRAETEADIASYLQTEKSLDKIQGFVDTLEFRFNQAGDRSMSIGERLGYRKAMTDYRLKEMAKREEEYAALADREIARKTTELEKRIDARMDDLEKFTNEMNRRKTEREDIISEWEKSIGRRLENVAHEARSDAAVKLQSMLLEETHMAVLQPGELEGFNYQKGHLPSEIMSLVTQFKTFVWALFRQHFIDRANMESAGYNPWVYRARLLATTSVLGGLSLILTDLVSGRDPREIIPDESDPDYKQKIAKFGAQAILKGGGGGYFADIAEALYSGSENQAKLLGLAGPALGYIGKDLSPMAFHGIKAMATGDEKETEKFTKNAYNSMKNITPGQNLWPIKAVLHNVLLHDLHEMADPGYAEKTKKRDRDNLGSEYWLGMGEDTRPPNFANIVGGN